MSLQSEIVTALASVAGGRVYPQVGEPEAQLPFVVYRVLNKRAENNFCGYSGKTNFSVAFDCWADTYAEALSIADAVNAAIEASNLVSYRDVSPGEDFELLDETFVEPTYFGFWYDAN